MSELNNYINEINDLCKKHQVNKLYAFGSVLNNNLKIDSDIDLIVDFHQMEIEKYADNYFNLKFSLEDIFKRPVDLLEDKAIKNPYFRDAINSSRKIIIWNLKSKPGYMIFCKLFMK